MSPRERPQLKVADTSTGYGGGITACYVCGAGVRPELIGVNEVVVCRQCGMGAIEQPPTSDDYWTRQDPDQLLEEVYWTARKALFAGALERLERQGVAGRALDLGGGVGYFCEIALRRGWDAYSVDASPLAVAAAAARVGRERSLPTQALADFRGTCDLVTLWCVIAHVPDPLALVRDALELLKPGGRLLITTPNFLFQKVYARLLARVGRPIDFVAHDHLLHFSPAALDGLLTKAGCQSWSYEYLGVTEECLVQRSLGRMFVPLKKAWNVVGVRAKHFDLPLLSSELQVLASKQPESPGPPLQN